MIILKVFKKIYTKLFGVNKNEKPDCEQDSSKVSNLIYDAIISDEPLMIARFGSTELTCLTNYLGVSNNNKNIFKYIKGEASPWWWEEKIMQQMQEWSGFFPPTQEKIEQFCELMLEDIKEIDVLGSWLSQEAYYNNLISHAPKVRLLYLEPFWTELPWSRALKGKKVLVIHPFKTSILKQYNEKRELLFNNKEILPEFDLKVIRSVQSLGGESTDGEYSDWFEALDSMKSEINNTDFDICLIGAGAYGLPLAAHVKRMGKQALHLGGSLQLLFGIKGARWENPEYGKESKVNYLNLFNEHWIRPLKEETSKNSKKVENACYW